MPPRRPVFPNDSQVLLDFPAGGLDESNAYARQPNGTCADALNVRAYDLSKDRSRGGSRPGISKYLPDRINAPVGTGGVPLPYSIQDINQIVTGPAARTAIDSYFAYARASTHGFSLGTAAGANFYTQDFGKTFSTSCWDGDGNCYAAEIAIESGVATVNKVSTSGGVAANPWEAQFTDTATVVGLVVVGAYLYVAITQATAPTSRIFKVATSDGTIVGGAYWLSTTENARLVFSNFSVNCLSAVGGLLGVATAGAASQFLVIDTADATEKANAGDLGTQNVSRACKVDTDGDYFYASLPLTSDKKVVKVGTDGTVVWTYTATDNNNTISYDAYTERVWVLGRDTGVIKLLAADTGSVAASPSLGTNWNDLDSDWNGATVLYDDSVASNDVRAVGPLMETLWTATLANALHTGSRVDRRDRLTRADLGRSRLLVVSGGRLSRITRTSTAVVTSGRAWSAAAPVVFSAQNGAFMYYVDGTTGYNRYSAASDSVVAWTASAGSMPVDSEGHGAGLICTWRGRTVVSGLPYDPQNWFMSKVDDPTDWDYSPATPTSTQAVAGNLSPAGLVGDVVTCLIPYDDDVLIVGCDHTIWVIRGDPADGGKIDRVSDSMGMAWGRPFARDPGGVVYFFASRGGVFAMTPGSKPERISQQITRRLNSINLDENIVRMAWDDRAQGLHVFVTPYDSTKETLHYYWDQRAAAWWPVKYADTDFNPKCCHAYDADLANDRVVLIGSWDSHVRAVGDLEQTTSNLGLLSSGRLGEVVALDLPALGQDDGRTFDSFVVIGPLLTSGLGELMLHELQATLGEDSADVAFEVRLANTPEKALTSAPVAEGVFGPGRSQTFGIRRAGWAIYVRLSASGAWAYERMRARLADLGSVRRRGF